jgi:N-acetylneuraminic acid mutarotase
MQRRIVRTRLSAILGSVAILVSGCAVQAAPSGTSTATATPTAIPGTPTATAVAPTNTSPPAADIGSWKATGSMSTARWQFTATVLRDGRVLVVGGQATPDESGPNAVGLASAELYDPSTGAWTATGSLHSPRVKHTATLLLDGRVLVEGGICLGTAGKGCPPLFSPDLDPSGAVATAEVYDPRTGKWSVTGSMTTPRAWHTATLLANGMVLVAGAEHADDNFGWPEPFARGILASTELYDPRTGRWTATGSMTTARTDQVAALLSNGKVLVAGGFGPLTATTHGALASADIYDPSTRKWAATGSLMTARAQGPAVALLGDGQVLVAGGSDIGDTSPPLASTELYDPNSGTWSTTGNLTTPRIAIAFTLLADGKVFIVGGLDLTGMLSSAELFDPGTGTWNPAGSLTAARFGHTATLLADGRVLVVGGLSGNAVASSAELYDEGSAD